MRAALASSTVAAARLGTKRPRPPGSSSTRKRMTAWPTSAAVVSSISAGVAAMVTSLLRSGWRPSVTPWEAVCTPPRLELGDGGNHLAPDRLDGRDPRHAAQRAVHLGEAQRGELAQRLDQVGGALAVLAGVEVVEHGLLDVVVVAALALAVLAQDLQLVAQVGVAEEVARIAVLRHQPQRLALTAAADDDGRVRPLQRLRRVEGALQRVVPAVVRRLVVAPHLQHDLQRLLESLEALADGREGEAEAARLLLVPGRADAEHGPPPGDDVERRHRLGEQRRLAVDHPRHHGEELDLRGAPGEEAEGGVRLQHLVLGGTDE